MFSSMKREENHSMSINIVFDSTHHRVHLIVCFLFHSLYNPRSLVFSSVVYLLTLYFTAWYICTCIRMMKPKQKTDYKSNRILNWNNINLNSGIRFFSIDFCWIDLCTCEFVCMLHTSDRHNNKINVSHAERRFWKCIQMVFGNDNNRTKRTATQIWLIKLKISNVVTFQFLSIQRRLWTVNMIKK